MDISTYLLQLYYYEYVYAVLLVQACQNFTSVREQYKLQHVPPIVTLQYKLKHLPPTDTVQYKFKHLPPTGTLHYKFKHLPPTDALRYKLKNLPPTDTLQYNFKHLPPIDTLRYKPKHVSPTDMLWYNFKHLPPTDKFRYKFKHLPPTDMLGTVQTQTLASCRYVELQTQNKIRYSTYKDMCFLLMGRSVHSLYHVTSYIANVQQSNTPTTLQPRLSVKIAPLSSLCTVISHYLQKLRKFWCIIPQCKIMWLLSGLDPERYLFVQLCMQYVVLDNTAIGIA